MTTPTETMNDKVKLTTNQMALALSALGDFGIHIRKRGDWYASVRAEIKRGAFLEGPSVSAPSPDAAVLALFETYTAPGTIVVLHANEARRRHVQWNGFIWADIS